MLESQTRNPKVASSSLGPAGIVGGRENVQRSLHPQPAGCVCTLDGLNAEHEFRVWVTILGCMLRHFHLSQNPWTAVKNFLDHLFSVLLMFSISQNNKNISL